MSATLWPGSARRCSADGRTVKQLSCTFLSYKIRQILEYNSKTNVNEKDNVHGEWRSLKAYFYQEEVANMDGNAKLLM